MTADDVDVGQIVTVLQWYEPEEETDWNNPFAHFAKQGKSKNTTHFGEVFRVAAVSLPYVALQRAFSNEVITVDLRELELTRVTKEYVKMMRAKYEQEGKSAVSYEDVTRMFAFPRWME